MGQSANGRVFDKCVGDIVCGVESIVHQDARYHATMFKTLEKSTALDVIFLVACNLLHEIERHYYDGTTFLRIIAFGQSANGMVFDKPVGDIVCGVESIVHQDARYKKCRSVFTDRHCIWRVLSHYLRFIFCEEPVPSSS